MGSMVMERHNYLKDILDPIKFIKGEREMNLKDSGHEEPEELPEQEEAALFYHEPQQFAGDQFAYLPYQWS